MNITQLLTYTDNSLSIDHQFQLADLVKLKSLIERLIYTPTCFIFNIIHKYSIQELFETVRSNCFNCDFNHYRIYLFGAEVVFNIDCPEDKIICAALNENELPQNYTHPNRCVAVLTLE